MRQGRKVAQTTITVALTDKQRKPRQHLRQMENISRRIIFEGIPLKGRRKRLSRKVLGLI
jgi:hypothetical protein